MEQFELDNVMQKLQGVYEVLSTGKITEQASRQWRGFFINLDYDASVSALDAHLANGERKPRPQDIKALMFKQGRSMGVTEGSAYKGCCPITMAALKASETALKADARTNSAWIIYHNLVYSGNPPVPGAEQKIQMALDEALIIVNEHGARFFRERGIDPVDDKYKLAEYWESAGGQ